jgi:hypothetical protein
VPFFQDSECSATTEFTPAIAQLAPTKPTKPPHRSAASPSDTEGTSSAPYVLVGATVTTIFVAGFAVARCRRRA